MSQTLQNLYVLIYVCVFVLDLIAVCKSDVLPNPSANSSDNNVTVGVKTNQDFTNRCSHLSGNGMYVCC